MTGSRRPPALIVKTVAVTSVTAAVFLGAVFFVVTLSARSQVRRAIQDQLEASQRMIGAIESRGQRELRLQAASVAESPTLKAAVDTYAAERRGASASVRLQLLNTMARELANVAARVEADAVILVDDRLTTIATAGPLGHRWPIGQLAPRVAGVGNDPADGVVRFGADIFRVAATPLLLGDGAAIGTLQLATSLDRRFARRLGELARTETAIISSGVLIASTLAPEAEQTFKALVPTLTASEGTLEFDNHSHAFRRLIQIGDTSVYAVASIDAASGAAVSKTTRVLVLIAIAAMSVALLGSIWLAHLLSAPIGQLSARLDSMAASRRFTTRLPLTGSSLEVDRLTETFNALMSSVAAAEAETEAAYTAAIRALAAMLDARDPYTAGHSERVSALSVAIGRIMKLPDDDLEVLRLGALLHDIGKIGVPDEILRKAGPLTEVEYLVIKQHPVLGARILRTVPFLARHLPIVELHHERPDGAGYPNGLRNDDIPLAAHIVHVADAYDAMTSARAYRRERPASAALRELRAGAGTDFHAEAVAALAVALPSVAPLFETPLEAVNA